MTIREFETPGEILDSKLKIDADDELIELEYNRRFNILKINISEIEVK